MPVDVEGGTSVKVIRNIWASIAIPNSEEICRQLVTCGRSLNNLNCAATGRQVNLVAHRLLG